jgi:hypothetical protein
VLAKKNLEYPIYETIKIASCFSQQKKKIHMNHSNLFSTHRLLLLALLTILLQQPAITPAHAQSAPFSTTLQATGTVTVVNGFIVGANLGNGGAGYPAPPWVSVVDPNGSNAVIVAVISADGVVTNLVITNAGRHYTAEAALTITPPPTNPIPNDINVIIGPYLTDDIRTWTQGTNYPLGGIYTNYAGISFFLAAFPGSTNSLGIVDTGLGSVVTPKTNNFPVNVTNAVTVYTLMNSDSGKANTTNGTLEFYGSQGAHASFNLVQGFNLRDHYNGSYNNVVSSNLMSLYWGVSKSVRLDCQGWMLPANFFSQALTNIQVRSYGSSANGIAVVAAITIRTGAPVFTFNPVGNQAVFSWPSTPTNYVLQTAAALNSPAWLTVTNPPVANNHLAVTKQMNVINQFYRLISVP